MGSNSNTSYVRNAKNTYIIYPKNLIMLKLLRHNTAHVCLFFFSPGATFGFFAFNFPPRLAWDLALHLGEKGKKNKTPAKKEKSMGEASRRGSLGRGKGKGGTAAALSPSPGHRWARFARRYFS